MSNTIQNETKYECALPEFGCALVATYLEGEEGNLLRKYTGQVEIKEVRNGCTYRNGALHSYNDQPAINNNEKQAWYKDGELHREGDLPALIDHSFTTVTSYYINGKLHRDGDMPAVESFEFSQWYKNGLLHREGGPAVIDDFQYEWWFNGKRHRDGGKPAFDNERTDTQQWWVDGVLIRSYFGGEDDISYSNEVNQKWDN